MNEEREHSRQYQKYAERYYRGGCTKQQLHRLTELGVLYEWEYEELTGEPFSS